MASGREYRRGRRKLLSITKWRLDQGMNFEQFIIYGTYEIQ